MKINRVIEKIEATGVKLSVRDGRLRIADSEELSQMQIEWLRQHRKEIIAELQTATIHDIDRHAAEKDAAIRYWRFRHNGVEVDIASGATITEAYDLLRCGPGDTLAPMIEYSEDNEDEQ